MVAGLQHLHMLLQFDEVQGPNALAAQLGHQNENAQDETEIADAVDDERFVAGDGIVVIVIPEADQEIRTETDALPADKQQEQIVAHDQHEHEKNKQVEIDKKAHHVLVVVHVTQGIEMN